MVIFHVDFMVIDFPQVGSRPMIWIAGLAPTFCPIRTCPRIVFYKSSGCPEKSGRVVIEISGFYIDPKRCFGGK